MKCVQYMAKRLMQLGWFALMATGLSACAGLPGFGGTSWREEVLLHDGNKIVVDRSVERGGRHEIGQLAAYSEQRLSFIKPGSQQTIRWDDHYSQDIGSAGFLPMLLDIRDGTAYLVAYPMGCLSYNMWGRPNPPYVIFKHDGKDWRRIPLTELPAEIKTPNLIFSDPDNVVKRIGTSFIPADAIQQIISQYRQPEYKTILREPLAKERCPQYSSSPRAPIPVAPDANQRGRRKPKGSETNSFR